MLAHAVPLAHYTNCEYPLMYRQHPLSTHKDGSILVVAFDMHHSHQQCLASILICIPLFE
jgi:hypothetical protein